jgi:hypothetical protein
VSYPTERPEVVEYVSADGLVATFEVERGTTGRMMPPVELYSDTVPLVPGSRYRGARHANRIVTLPIVTGGTRYGRDELRTLARTLDPVRGMGLLRATTSARQLNCVYQAGLDALAENFPHFSRAALQFLATDPYWVDTLENTRDLTPANIDSEWFPFFPLDLGGTNILGEFSVVNMGDADAWPRIEVWGPGSGFQFYNLTTGERTVVDGEVPGGQFLTINTLPGQRDVSVSGSNWFSRLSRDSTLWAFAPGFNQLRLAYATTEAHVLVRWRLRYLAP